MQRIIPNLWFDGNAAEAVAFYEAVIPNTRHVHTEYYPTEGLLDWQAHMAGKELVVTFEIDGYKMVGINAGPEFPMNPSVSFFLNFDPSVDPDAREHLDATWEALVDGGKVLMPLDSYDFSPRYGWLQDKYGTPWQLMLTDAAGEPRPFVIPCLLFGGPVFKLAADALAYYSETFPGSKIGANVPRPGDPSDPSTGSVMFADIQLLGQWFALMDSQPEQDFTFSCGVSLSIECEDQDEIDHYWDALSRVPQAEQCGWCADAFGVSWQILPRDMGQYMSKPGAYQKMMSMKKIDLAAFG